MWHPARELPAGCDVVHLCPCRGTYLAWQVSSLPDIWPRRHLLGSVMAFLRVGVSLNQRCVGYRKLERRWTLFLCFNLTQPWLRITLPSSQSLPLLGGIHRQALPFRTSSAKGYLFDRLSCYTSTYPSGEAPTAGEPKSCTSIRAAMIRSSAPH